MPLLDPQLSSVPFFLIIPIAGYIVMNWTNEASRRRRSRPGELRRLPDRRQGETIIDRRAI